MLLSKTNIFLDYYIGDKTDCYEKIFSEYLNYSPKVFSRIKTKEIVNDLMFKINNSPSNFLEKNKLLESLIKHLESIGYIYLNSKLFDYKISDNVLENIICLAKQKKLTTSVLKGYFYFSEKQYKFIYQIFQNFCSKKNENKMDDITHNDKLIQQFKNSEYNPTTDCNKIFFNLVNKFPMMKENKDIVNDEISKLSDNTTYKLFLSNQRLSVNISKKYQDKGLSFIDLIHETNKGLYKSIQRFDSKRTLAFSTYTFCWMLQTSSRGTAEKGPILRMPVHIYELRNKINAFINKSIQNDGISPTISDIAKELKVPEKKIKYVMDIKTIHLTMDKNISNKDENNNEKQIFGDVFNSDDNKENEFNKIINEKLIEDVKRIIKSLPERERIIITYRFELENLNEDMANEKMSQLFNKKKRTLNNIGEYLNLTRERARQLEKKAINTIKKELSALT